MSILATCASLAAILAAAKGGETVTLRGDCQAVTVSRTYAKTLTVDASAARIAGLVLSGANVRWIGGTVSAPAGLEGKGPAGYGVLIRGGRNIRFEQAVVTAARKGMVVDKAQRVAIDRVQFTRLREDGIIASETAGLSVTNSTFSDSSPLPTRCQVAGRPLALGVPKRFCEGTWTDGDHPDAVQMRNGVTDVHIANNVVRGPTQGITQMDTTGDAPLARVLIEGNRIETSASHQITLYECEGCTIRRNVVRAAPGWGRRAVIRPGKAARCGNDTKDETADQRCR